MKLCLIGVVVLLLSSCSENELKTLDLTGVTGQQRVEAMQKWSRSCALCHVRGEGGAPKSGDREAWHERLEQGQTILLEHTVQGFNRMPPLGYCMDCNRDDFLILIEFMAGGAG